MDKIDKIDIKIKAAKYGLTPEQYENFRFSMSDSEIMFWKMTEMYKEIKKMYEEIKGFLPNCDKNCLAE